MNQTTQGTSCQRKEDLVSFLYGETSEYDARDFEKHLQECSDCHSEFVEFRQVRESVAEWKMEALTGFSPDYEAISQQPARQRSAIAAFREFFALSPLWTKGAVAFATLLFCVLAGLTLGRLVLEQSRTTNVVLSDAKYSEQQMQAILRKALADKAVSSPPDTSADVTVVQSKASRHKRTGRAIPGSVQMAKGRRPLSKSERDQLAADLRLLSTPDDEGLNLLGDRINQ